MKTWLFVSTVVIAAGALLYAQDRRQRAEADHARQEMARLSAAVAQLERRGSADVPPWRAPQAPVAARPPEEATAATADRDTSQERPVGPSPRKLTGKEVAANHEVAFRAEPVERAWAEPMEARVSAGMREVFKDPTKVRSVECRQSLCRVEASMSDQNEWSEIVERMLEEKVWDGVLSAFPSTGADGKVTLTTYLVREGYQVPLPAKEL